ncbi:glycosyltransferase-like protein [Companilactobacillus mindensis DSM 14500]|uniref:Glycosyltransferase-like protein n=1 Tax=Companilactobacillus mindensis DSM 14500 TaxID=1423770 RepID=A0A0R1QGX2_9LACO|nr:glycosyltransferase family 2 protein [Companilactobacillus mindensis]KRL44047.1 glycosyltransferase-like protein [Companilactobacillus mindensis DSM 14500]GEO79358.1 glycosyl transferase [Companilactobacillus mindensis]
MVKNKLSIIMTAYNVADYISSTIDSVIAQTNQDFNLIIVDDCSTDQTQKITRSYEKDYDWISVICHSENQGVSAARNTGLKHADGELITFIDGDDRVEPDYVDHFLTIFNNEDVDMVTCGFFNENENGKVKNKIAKRQTEIVGRDEVIKQIIKMTGTVMGYTWNKAYIRSIIEENQLAFATDLDLMEDQVFNVEYATVARKFYLDNVPLYHYISRKGSITQKFAVENVRDVGVARMKVYKTIRDSTRNEKNQI